MHKITNPHDKFFKEVMSHIEIVRDFLMQYLPPEKARHLDFETLSAEKDSHIGEDLRELFSDLIFRV
ncbi:MAG TPA: Rpn family recombination-promoting nuclease/putative transposase, partial [Thermotogota bacterium]|nr:Rpn family recombination-promoting nuclease/putative transposase [Thermotogota bacterium]